MKNLFVYKPLLIFLLLFLLDKIFLFPPVNRIILPWKKFEPAIYASREDLFAILKIHHNENKHPHTGLILGSSRSAWFSAAEIEKQRPFSRSYNFSAPLANPAWHYFWLERILQAKIKPSFVILEADFLLFSEVSSRMPLSYSFDPGFMLSHIAMADNGGFSTVELEMYFAKNLFALYRYPLDISSVRGNLKKSPFLEKGKIVYYPAWHYHDILHELITDANRNRYGSIVTPFHTVMQPQDDEKESDKAFSHLLLDRFHATASQIYFFNKLLHRLAQENIPVFLYKPPMSPGFNKKLQQNRKIQEFDKKLNGYVSTVKAEYPQARIFYSDLNEKGSMQCQQFNDPYHITGNCFAEMTRIILKTE